MTNKYMRTTTDETIHIIAIKHQQIVGVTATHTPYQQDYPDLNVVVLGACLTRNRQYCGLTQQDVADYAGLSNRYVCDIENGKVPNPKILHIQAMAAACGVDLITFLQQVQNETDRRLAE